MTRGLKTNNQKNPRTYPGGLEGNLSGGHWPKLGLSGCSESQQYPSGIKQTITTDYVVHHRQRKQPWALAIELGVQPQELSDLWWLRFLFGPICLRLAPFQPGLVISLANVVHHPSCAWKGELLKICKGFTVCKIDFNTLWSDRLTFSCLSKPYEHGGDFL